MSADPRHPAEAAADPVGALMLGLMRRTHMSTPSDTAAVVADEAAAIGAGDVDVLLIDYEQDVLVPLPTGSGEARLPLSVSGTVAGRAYARTTILRAPLDDDGGGERLWLPLLDGTERLGVVGMSFAEPASDELVEICERFAHLVAMLIVTKGAYGDAFEEARRRRPMTLASELLWQLVPPLVFATDGLALAGMLEPAYDNGGDALDYAINDRTLHVAIFDAMGHGLPAAGVAAFALSAYRQSRRAGADLLSTHAAMDAAVGEQFPDERFVTALIAELDLDTGRLRWIAAGHPAPLVIRGGRARSLERRGAPPLGIGVSLPAPQVASESLEPGDLLLLYTDGLTELRRPDGTIFDLDRLSEFVEREAAAGESVPETLRRLRRSVVHRPDAELRDDATAVLLAWKSGNERAMMPPTVL
jgi:Stage II sporulation protein E (SpoIIE)